MLIMVQYMPTTQITSPEILSLSHDRAFLTAITIF